MATTCLQNGTKAVAPGATGFSGLALQRKCACGGSAGVMSDCNKCSNQKLSLQRSTEHAELETRNSDGAPPIVHDVRRSPGQPLGRETRAFIEPSFGHDFSRVRVNLEARETEKVRQTLPMSASNPGADQSKLSESGPSGEGEDVTQPTAPTYGVTPEPMDDGKAAKPKRNCKLKSGPTYSPSGTVKATKSGGSKNAAFDLSAEFENDTITGADASCCEVRQYILWTKAADVPNHAGFKPAASFSDNTWYEDRDSVGKRYGHRTGAYSECIDINHYEDAAAKKDCAKGAVFKGSDTPMDGSGAKTGEWRFQLKAIDTCDGGKDVGTAATVTVDWNV